MQFNKYSKKFQKYVYSCNVKLKKGVACLQKHPVYNILYTYYLFVHINIVPKREFKVNSNI